MEDNRRVKFHAVMGDPGRSAWRKYRDLQYGEASLARALKTEWLLLLCGGLPGAAGLLLRRLLYPSLFAGTGRGVIFGRDLTLRHAHKIRLGNRVVVDDNCVLDAKGETNAGIQIGDDVYVGRNTIIYCKNGDIRIGSSVNISSNCQIFSSNRLTIGEGTVVGAYSYFLSGGNYDYADPTPFSQQSGMLSRGELTIGPDCWIGARVTVLDAASVGARCVIGAGAVVTRPIPPGSLAVGVPARVVRSIAAAV